MRALVALLSCIGFLSSTTYAAESIVESSIEDFLNRFHENPREVMDQLPQIIGPNGEVIERGQMLDFSSPLAIEVMEQTAASREWVIERAQPAGDNSMSIMAAPLERDYPQAVVHDKRVYNNIFEIHSKGWSEGRPSIIPWSDSYWPRTKGVVGQRYADPSFPRTHHFVTNHNYVKSRPASSYVPHAISQLSPAEKYDLLIGDRGWNLTKSAWAVGQQSQARWGYVPTWEGICHGWAAAAHMGVQPPESAVTVQSVDGHSITFRESDIKGLLSYLWAEVYLPTNYSGHVCRKYGNAIRRDEVGRIIDADCFNTNPASWHLAVVNQIGRLKKSLAADVNWDSAIWNYPLAGYKATYYNPQTKRPSNNPRAAIIPIEDFRIDKFKKYRSPKARYIVGVAMDVEHTSSMQPVLGKHRSEPYITKVRWVYDLELDSNYNIIGGEWYTTIHPDFLWTFDANAKPNSDGDRQIMGLDDSWSGRQIPQSWAEAARISSAKGEPLRMIVERLRDMSLSSQTEETEEQTSPMVPEEREPEGSPQPDEGSSEQPRP